MKSRNTHLVTAGAIARMIFVGSVIMFIRFLTPIPGGIVAGLLLLGALSVEALAMLVGMRMASGKTQMVLDHIQSYNESTEEKEVTDKLLFNFTVPLILTSFIGTFGTSIINMGLIRSANPAIALSAFSVGWDLGMIFISPLNMFHQIPLNYLQGNIPSHFKSVKRFAKLTGLTLFFMLSVISFTPVGHFLLRNYMGVSEEISVWSIDVLKFMSIIPLIAVMREYFWGIMFRKHITGYIVKGKSISLISLGIAVAVLTWIRPANPAIIGAAGMLISQLIELIYLYLSMKKIE